MPRPLEDYQRLKHARHAQQTRHRIEAETLVATSQLHDVPHMLGCLKNEVRIDAMERYLMGELDYVKDKPYPTKDLLLLQEEISQIKHAIVRITEELGL